MAETAANQLRRILHLIPMCEDDAPHPIEAMAAALDSDRKTLLRDLKALSDRFDDPGGFVEGVQLFVEPGRFSLRSDHFRRPMRLTLGELGALDLGLAMLERERPPDEQDAIRRARERLRQALSRLPGNAVQDPTFSADQGADADPETLRTLRDALRHGRMLSIRYAGSSAPEATERQVGPLALAPSRGHWFLVALFEGQLRIYRVDRVRAADCALDCGAGREGARARWRGDGRVSAGRPGLGGAPRPAVRAGGRSGGAGNGAPAGGGGASGPGIASGLPCRMINQFNSLQCVVTNQPPNG
jgi:predicted DNA-binding transcriptional regulator YafY